MSKFKHSIGTRIEISTLSFVNYNEQGERILHKEAIPLIQCTICGIVKRALGKYHKGSHRGFFGEDPDPPYLHVSSFLHFYECRTKINSKPFLVHPDDIKCLP